MRLVPKSRVLVPVLYKFGPLHPCAYESEPLHEITNNVAL